MGRVVGTSVIKVYINESKTSNYSDAKTRALIACSYLYLPVNSKTAHSPPPQTIPGHLTRAKLRTVGNLTQNDACPVRHLTFLSKRLLAVGNQRISQFFDSAREPPSRVIALVDSMQVFLLFLFHIVISWNMPLLKVWSEDKLNKKFVMAENFEELVSKGKRFCSFLKVSDSVFPGVARWGGGGVGRRFWN